jgi:subtilisin family serine protease
VKRVFIKRLFWLILIPLLGGCKDSLVPTPWGVRFEEISTAPAASSELLDSVFPERTSSSPVAGLILRLKPGFRTLASDATLELFNRYQAVSLEGRSLSEAIAFHSKRPEVEGVFLNHRVRISEATVTPNDILFAEQWGPQAIHCPEAWAWIDSNPQLAAAVGAVTVGVVDSGVDAGHPDLAGRVTGRKFLTDSKGNPLEGTPDDFSDLCSHGTHVAGIIAASRNNLLGIAGVANFKILAVKTMDKDGSGSEFDIIEGIKYAVKNGARVINLSLGLSETMVNAPFMEALQYAAQATFSIPAGGVATGSLILAAAGNDGASVMAPATDPNAIAVSSTSQFAGTSPLNCWEFLSAFSNRGVKVEVSAPGGRILSTIPLGLAAAKGLDGQPYAYKSGTSMATPYASAVAALILARHPDWSAEQLRNKLRESVDDLGAPGRDPLYGFGRVNALKAIQ